MAWLLLLVLDFLAQQLFEAAVRALLTAVLCE
jgi:hypothetical protein